MSDYSVGVQGNGESPKNIARLSTTLMVESCLVQRASPQTFYNLSADAANDELFDTRHLGRCQGSDVSCYIVS